MIRQRNLIWLLSSEYRLLQHPLFWLTIYFPRILDMLGARKTELVVVHVFLLLSNIFLVYFNIYFLVRQYFLRKKVTEYLILSAITILGMAFLNAVFFRFVTEPHFTLPPLARIAENAVFTASLLGTALAFHILKHLMVSQNQLKSAESAQLLTEINFLKSQINPHFLFNALNNIQVQLRTNTSDAAETISHLSALLRYQLYDSARESVKLKDEVDFLHNFLKIHHMRTGGEAIDFQVTGDLDEIKVSPYLFIPFVENAVKHSRGLGGYDRVRIRMRVDAQDVYFEIENGKPKMVGKKDSAGGIGLVNVSRRLDLLYPKRYFLDIDNSEQAYRVKLKVRY
jgi:two-component system, LytTR family, sensor kinase